jgi:hypothetical protein
MRLGANLENALDPAVFIGLEKIWGVGKVAAAPAVQRGPQGREARVCVEVVDAERNIQIKTFLHPQQLSGTVEQSVTAAREAVKSRTDHWDRGQPEEKGSRATPIRRGRPPKTDSPR